MKTRAWILVGMLVAASAAPAGAAEWFVATNGSDAAAGTNWATAKLTIQAGVDGASDGETVWVSNGAYATGERKVAGLQLTNRVVIDRPISVRSVNGPECTVIRGAGPNGDSAVRCVYVGTNAMLAGFTLTQGSTRASYTNSEVDRYGGGAYAIGIISNCSLIGNSAQCGGGGAGGFLIDCLVASNSSSLYGGGTFNGHLIRCTLRNNESGSCGGGAFGGTLDNCLVSENGADYGGGVWGSPLSNCTVVGNCGSTSGAGVRNCPSRNTIIYGNIGSQEVYGDDLLNCCTSDPKFVNAPAGDYRPAPDSPCVDAGNNAFVQGTTDLRGATRVVNGIVDIGAYEKQAGEVDILRIQPVATNVACGATNGLVLKVTANMAWTATSSVPWLAITSGQSGTSNGTVTFDVEANEGAWRTGTIAVAGGQLGCTCTVVQARPPTCVDNWFVATNGSDAAAGTNWATAKLTIQAAVDVSRNGDSVWVGAGTYQERLTIPKGIWLRSVDGPCFTTIFANEQGRCITITHSNAVVSGFTITGGRSRYGGGVNMAEESLIENCVVSNNGILIKTDLGDFSEGGGIYGGRARNCLITGNFVDISGWTKYGIASSKGGGAAKCLLENCTVVRNWTYADGDYQWSEGGGGYDCTFINAIVWGNMALRAFWPGSLDGDTFDHTFTNDPQFVDAEAGNYRLSTNSPCLNAGASLDWMSPATDLDGHPRIARGRVDLGAYERHVLNVSPLGTNLSAAAAGGLSFEVAAEVAWTATANVPWLSIVSGDSGATNGTVSFDVAANGTGFERTGAILVSDGELEWWYIVVQAVVQAERPLNLNWYVTTNGSDAADGITWATAKRTIQAGVDAAVDGEVVWVGAGTYTNGGRGAIGTVHNRVVIDKPITVQSADGPESTRIDGLDRDRCVYLANGATLSGFTLTNGASVRYAEGNPYDGGGGGAYCESDTMATNCIFANNHANYRGGGVYGGGTLVDCTLIGNRSDWLGGGATYARLIRCLCRDNFAGMSGGGVDECTLSNCTVSDNTGPYGGGAVNCTLDDCLIQNNEASARGGGVLGGTLQRCVVRGNRSGGAAEAVLNNCLVVGNYSVTPGGGALDCTLVNCTVVDNVATDGGGVYGGTASNCIVYGNAASNAPNHANAAFSFSCTTPDPGGTGNVANDPRFADAGAGNYRLAADSPCRDAGDNGAVLGATDLDGNQRIAFGAVDMGAYEHLAAAGIVLIAQPGCTNVGAGAASGLTLDVMANVAWTASTNAPWLAFASGESGTTNGTVTFGVAANEGAAPRTGAVIVAGGGLARTCTVVQAAFVPALAIEPAGAYVGTYASGGRSLAVTANIAWTATTNAPWLTIESGGSGTTNGTIVFSVAANAGPTRTGAVIVSGGGFTRICAVVQADFVPSLDLYPASTNLACFAASGLAIDVLANVAWTATTNAPWLALASGESGIDSGTVAFDVATNAGPTRTGAVIVAGGGLTRTCTVVQAASPVLEIAPADVHLSFSGGTGHAVQVTANLAWTATTNAPWLAITSGESGIDSGTVAFDVATNAGTARTGAVIVAGGGLTRTCTVVQFKNSALFVDWFVATNGSDVAAGTNWATAKQTIQAAVDAAEACDAVWVSNGVYATGGRVVGGASNLVAIDRPITARSVNGPEVTVILGPGTNSIERARCAYVGTNALLSGFTLTNGLPGGSSTNRIGGGAYIAGGMVEQCTISGNYAFWGAGVYIAGDGILSHCRVVGNSAGDSGGGGGVFGSGGGQIDNCLIAGNYAEWAPGVRANAIEMNNCTISGNSSFGGPAVAAPTSTLWNCIVYSNNVDTDHQEIDGDPVVLHSCSPGLSGNGNVAADPQFVDAGSGNYRLQATSPCVDAGDNGVVPWAEDLDGNPRIAFGAVDMGAYEAQLSGVGAWFGAIVNGLTNDLDCAAGDGMPNLLKYATGGSPRIADDSGFVGGSGNGLWPILTFHRNPSATDVRFVVESAERMASGAVWRGVATNLGGSWLGATNVAESGTGNPVECAVTDPVALESNRFLRLRVSRP